jgi:hypothetical protein
MHEKDNCWTMIGFSKRIKTIDFWQSLKPFSFLSQKSLKIEQPVSTLTKVMMLL